MKKRLDKDLDVLRNPEIMVQEVMLWTRELFLGAGTEKFRIPKDLLEFGFGIMLENLEKAESAKIKKMILRKILHTREVVVAGIEILEGLGGEQLNPFMAGAVTFAHDLGRFSQAHLGSYSDSKTGFDHAKASAELILGGSFLESEKQGIDVKRVAEAVRHHSAREYGGGDIYGKFIRDADKLGLLDYFHYHIYDYEFPEGSVTEGAIESFLKGELVPHKYINNRVDVFLCWLSWQFDFNFEVTRELFETGGAKEFIVSELKKNEGKVWERIVDVM